jgi:hypothetical protein
VPEIFSASRAGRHIMCHASAQLELAIPNWVPPEVDETKDNAANRGTHMHTVFAELMGLRTRDAEMMGRAVDYVARIKDQRPRLKSLIEEPRRADWLATRPWTTADLVLHLKDELHVLDLKTGQVPVSAVENMQLMFYARTYLDLAPNAKGVTVHIVQPWADNMESWYVTGQRLKQFEAQALLAEAAIQGGSTTFGPSDHCMFCPANPHGRGARGAPNCPAMMGFLYPQYNDYDAMMED